MKPIFTVEKDPHRFRERVSRFFELDPVGRTLPMTVLDSVVAGVYPDSVLAAVESPDRMITACAVQTPPHNVIVTAETRDDMHALAHGLRAEGLAFPGVVGLAPGVHDFAAVWCDGRGPVAVQDRASRLFRIDALVPPRPAPGLPRGATEDDLDLIVDWTAAFVGEVGGIKPTEVRPMLTHRITAGRVWLWVHGAEIVSFLGHSPVLAGHARIGPVYTPLEHRGAGFASNLVAHVSAQLLERQVVPTLFTDLANPTSNAIYQAVGYTPVADAFELSFVEDQRTT